MKIAFYLENHNICNVDLRFPKRGNPGIGGTEFNFVTLAVELSKRYHFLSVKMFAQNTLLLPAEINNHVADNCLKALQAAVEQGYDFFVWRPTVRDDARRLVSIINSFPIKFIIWAHNTPSEEMLAKLASAQNVRQFIPVSEWQRRSIRNVDVQRKTTRIYNGFDISSYQGNSEKDNNLVVYVGSLIPVKGFGLLAKAWPKVAAECPDAKLVVIGSGQLYNRNAVLGLWGIAEAHFERSEIVPYLGDDAENPIPSVSFNGVMGVDKIPLLKKAICGVVNPTGKGENCPGSAIELLAAGTAVVSADREGIRDVVDDGFTGLLGIGEHELAENIILLLKHTGYAKTLGANGPGVVRERFNYEQICEQWVSLLAEQE